MDIQYHAYITVSSFAFKCMQIFIEAETGISQLHFRRELSQCPLHDIMCVSVCVCVSGTCTMLY